MAGTMAKTDRQAENNDLVLRAATDADALGQLYELYYEPIYRFCLHRLFYKEIAEDITSTVFLQVARKIAAFTGTTHADFRNWLYAIAANHSNSYIRKTLRRRRLLKRLTSQTSSDNNCPDQPPAPDWPTVYQAVLKLKPNHQTIVTLRFFENMDFEQIAKIINARPATVRVTLHRILRKLRNHLQKPVEAGQ